MLSQGCDLPDHTCTQDFDEAVKDSNFAELRKKGILLTKFHVETHPSQPNYMAAISGDYFGLNHDEMVRYQTTS